MPDSDRQSCNCKTCVCMKRTANGKGLCTACLDANHEGGWRYDHRYRNEKPPAFEYRGLRGKDRNYHNGIHRTRRYFM